MNLYNQKKIIYLISSPLSERDFKRYGIKNWINQGWKVNVFDFTFFLFPKFWKFINGNKSSYNFEGLKFFRNINEGLKAIKSLEQNVVFIDLLGFSSLEMQIRKAAKIHGVLVRLCLGSLPEPNNKKSIFDILSLIKNPTFILEKLIFFVQNKFEKFRLKKNIPDYLVISAKKYMVGIHKKKTSVIKAHSFDYDFFIKKKNFKSNKKRRFLVFLDEDGPYHSDYVRLGIRPFVTADKYFPVIDFGLTKIAKSLKLDIKIAAHPRSNYKVKRKKYTHPIIQNKTFELIRNANLIVAHSSTALHWAIIMKKPIIFVTTDEIQNSIYARSYVKLIKNFAKTLGTKVINLSDTLNKIKYKNYLRVDKKKYENFIDDNIKIKGSPQELVWNIIIKKIENDLYPKKNIKK